MRSAPIVAASAFPNFLSLSMLAGAVLIGEVKGGPAWASWIIYALALAFAIAIGIWIARQSRPRRWIAVSWSFLPIAFILLETAVSRAPH